MPIRHACLAASLVVLAAQPATAHANLFQEASAAAHSRQFERAEQMLRDWLKTHPWDKEAHLLLGKTLAHQSRYTEALSEFDALLQKRPRNPYYLLAKAETLIEAGRPQEALPLLKLARAVKPSKEQIWRLQIAALLKSGGDDRRRQAAVIQQEAQHRFPDAYWNMLAEVSESSASSIAEVRAEMLPESLSLQLAMSVRLLPGRDEHTPEKPPAPLPLPVAATPEQASAASTTPPAAPYDEIEAGYSRERFDQYYQPWQAAYITASRQFSEDMSAYATYRQTQRFGLNDHEIWAGYYASPLPHWNAHIEGSLSPTHRILARWSLFGQLGYTFDNGIGTSMGMRRTTYETASNNSIGVLVERYFGKLRAAAGTWKSRLDIGGAWVETNQVQAEYYYGDRNYVGLYYNGGQEVFVGWDSLPETAGSISWTASGTHWVTRNWAATYSYLRYSQEDWYTRSGFNIGARRRF